MSSSRQSHRSAFSWLLHRSRTPHVAGISPAVVACGPRSSGRRRTTCSGDEAGSHPTYYLSAQLWQIDPGSNRVVSRLPLGSTYKRDVNPVIGDVETGENGLWLSRIHERRLVLIDPNDGVVLKEVAIGRFQFPWEFAIVDDNIWVGDLNTKRMARIDPETKKREFFGVGRPTSFVGSGFGAVWVPLPGLPPDGGQIVRID
jgi:hypothetical protein